MLHQYCPTIPLNNTFNANSIRPGDVVIVPDPKSPQNKQNLLLCIAWTPSTGLIKSSNLLQSLGRQVRYPSISCKGPTISSALLRTKSLNTAVASLCRVPTETAIRIGLVYPQKFHGTIPSTTMGPRITQLLQGCVVASGFEIQLSAGSLKDFTLVVRSTQPSACAVRIVATTTVVVSCDDQDEQEESIPLNNSLAAISGEQFTDNNHNHNQNILLEGPAQEIRELLLAPVLWKDKLKTYNVQLPRGVLLSGPPGVGKTRSVRLACASCRRSSNNGKKGILLQLFTINGADLFASSSIGGATSTLRSVFAAARKHVETAKHAVSCIFIDEIDVVCPSRDRNDNNGSSSGGGVEVVRLVSQLLTLMDGIDETDVTETQKKARQRVVVCAATNRPNVLDSALRRPGRFDREIRFTPPNVQERQKILESLVKSIEPITATSSSPLPLPLLPTPFQPLPTALPLPPTLPVSSWFEHLTRLYQSIGDPVGKNGTLKSSVENVENVLKKYCNREQILFKELFRRYKLSTQEQALYPLVHTTETETETETKTETKSETKTKIENKLQESKGDTTTLISTPTLMSPTNINVVPISSDISISNLAEMCVGYTGADLQALVRTSAIRAATQGHACVSMNDFNAALATITPSSMRGHTTATRTVLWEDLGGLKRAKLEIQKAIVWPLRRAATFQRLGASPPRGVLLYGPPGCGKTSLVLALVHDLLHATFLTLTPSDVYSAYVGDSERTIREIFSRARACVPALLFLDEMDAIVGSRGLEGSNDGGSTSDVQARILSTLLNEMDGVSSSEGLIIVGATNRLESIDPALLRSGRFGSHVEVGLPNLEERLDILNVALRDIPHVLLELETVAKDTEEWSGAELRGLCREAAMFALRNDRLCIEQIDVEQALKELLK